MNIYTIRTGGYEICVRTNVIHEPRLFFDLTARPEEAIGLSHLCILIRITFEKVIEGRGILICGEFSFIMNRRQPRPRRFFFAVPPGSLDVDCSILLR